VRKSISDGRKVAFIASLVFVTFRYAAVLLIVRSRMRSGTLRVRIQDVTGFVGGIGQRDRGVCSQGRADKAESSEDTETWKEKEKSGMEIR